MNIHTSFISDYSSIWLLYIYFSSESVLRIRWPKYWSFSMILFPWRIFPSFPVCISVCLCLSFSVSPHLSFILSLSPMLLLLLSRFSCVLLCTTPETAAHQAPPSLGFSRQEHWSGLPFPSPMHERKSESEVTQSCPTLSNPMDCSLPGSSVHGIY